MEEKTIRFFALIMAFLLFVSCPLSVYASEKWEGSLGLTLYYNLDEIKQYVKDTVGFWIYYGHQVGAFLTADFEKFVNNSNKFDELLSDNKVGLYKDDSGNVKGVYTSKEFMAELKALIDQYAKENEPYYMVNTMTLDDMVSSGLKNKVIFDTVSNLIDESKSNIIAFAVERGGSKMFFADIGSDFRNISAVKQGNNQSYVYFYDNETWALNYIDVYRHSVGNEALVYNDFVKTADFIFDNDDDFGVRYIYQVIPFNHNGLFSYEISNYDYLYLITKEKRRIRVFNTYGDFQNFTLGKRSVYYTEKYYNYVPEDLSVSIDELEKTVDDLQKVIDELLKQITDDTDEKQIEELLKQILEEIRNGQGSGGGGSGSGDVNVDIDLSGTNTLLSKILAKVTQINDKISSSVGKTMDDVVTSIDDLGKMLKKYLSEITGDLDDIKEQLEQISEQEFSEKSDSFLDSTKDSFSEIGEAAKDKFPFSIPDDMRKIVAALSPKPPEPETQALKAGTNTLYIMSGNEGDIVTVSEGVRADAAGSGWSETGAPVFRLPLVVNSVGWNYEILVDLSDFQSVASLCRTYMTLVYIWALLMLSIKIVGLWGELVD